MSTPARRAEADEASVAFQAALAQVGAKTVADAMVLWEDIPPTGRASVAASWLAAATKLVLSRRRHSRELARAYYRLTRALLTGKTVADPYNPEPSTITLSTLRSQFAQLAGTEPVDGDDEQIAVEELDGLSESEERLERDAEAELQTVLAALGPNNLDRKLRDIDTAAPATEVDALRKEAHKQAGARQAAAAQRIGLNGARSNLWNHQQRDSAALGYARVSRSGTPCGWCAMLISRGPVYKSENSATRTYGDGDLYHDNCVCYAVPVFSLDQYESSPLFALNRQYSELWPRVTQGLGGKSAVSAWRRYIRTETPTRAQAA